jgi:Mrp family chromosome partitioning ATPase
LIARATLGLLLRRLEKDFDVILLDTPCWTEGTGARMTAMAAKAAVQLVTQGRTGAAAASGVAREIANVGAYLLGAIANRP